MRALWHYAFCMILVEVSYEKRTAPALQTMGVAYAKQGQFPYYGFLSVESVIHGIKQKSFCGATLIHPQWLVTAAHCITKTSSEIEHFRLKSDIVTLHMGSVKAQDDTADIRKVTHVIVHPKYIIEFMDDNSENGEEARIENDIALGLLRNKYFLNNHISPILLPQKRPLEDPLTNLCETGYLIGMGNLHSSSYPGQVLYSVVQPLTRTNLSTPKPKPCVDSVFYTESKVASNRRQAMEPRSGGAFTCVMKNEADDTKVTHVLRGLVSAVYSNTVQKTVVTVYEAVEKHMDFIQEYIEDVKIFEDSRLEYGGDL